MKNKLLLVLLAFALNACSDANDSKKQDEKKPIPLDKRVAYDQKTTKIDTSLLKKKKIVDRGLPWVVDRFAEFRILRYRVPGFVDLPLQQKKLLYFLSQAALSGRDIIWDQNFSENLTIRRTLEEIVKFYEGNRKTDTFKRFMLYTKQVWFANGIHHHYSNNKFAPTFSCDELKRLMEQSPNGAFPLEKDETIDDLYRRIYPIIFDPKYVAKKVNKAQGIDKVKQSAVNFYKDVTEQEVRDYYASKKADDPKRPPSFGLNSQLVKKDGKIIERVWKVGGMYTEAIEKVVYWLKKAIEVAENDKQKKALSLLVEYYETGDLKKFDEYNIAWVNDTESDVDVINGFIEVYNDPLAYRGSFESVVSVRNVEATKTIQAIAEKAQWFEDNMPMDDAFKKEKVKGITGKSITVVMESGDASPSTPIGINLPNSDWIRAEHGSKSVSLGNIVYAYDQAKGKSLQEFAWDNDEIVRAKKYAGVAHELHVDLHEVVGHASGKINPGVGTPKETLKQYASTLEEARADLVGLYYLLDPMLVEMGVSPSLDVGKVAYDSYIRNGMMQQLRRIKLGEDIEEDHMRNRQLVAAWVLEKGAKDKVIERRVRDNKTYFIVKDYNKLRSLFGQLLGEIQRIKSEGDFKSAQALVENYGVKVDKRLHKEVLKRYEDLDIAPYSGFVNPILTPIERGGEIIDIKLTHPKNFTYQMLHYAKEYSFLPNKP